MEEDTWGANGRQTDRWVTGGQTGIHRQARRKTHRQGDSKTDRQTCRKTGRQTDRQRGR